MIITCNNCNKKFNVDANIIPENGRLLQCNGCNHKWFFKKEIANEPVKAVKINKPLEESEFFKEDVRFEEKESPEAIELLESQVKGNFVIKKNSLKDKSMEKEEISENINSKIEISKNNKNYNILSLMVVFIISFIALIIFFDTFQGPMNKIFPNIEFLLYNLYETINDVVLFINDLI